MFERTLNQCQKGVVKTYRCLFSHAWILYIAFTAALFTIGLVGMAGRSTVTDVFKLWTIDDNTERVLYNKYEEEWGRTEVVSLIISTTDGTNIWSYPGLHVLSYVDAAIRYIDIPVMEGDDMLSASEIAEAYSLNEYDTDKLVCDCPFCLMGYCLSTDGLKEISVETSVNPYVVITFSAPKRGLSKSLLDICLRSPLLELKALMMTKVTPQYRCVTKSPLMFIDGDKIQNEDLLFYDTNEYPLHRRTRTHIGKYLSLSDVKWSAKFPARVEVEAHAAILEYYLEPPPANMSYRQYKAVLLKLVNRILPHGYEGHLRNTDSLQNSWLDDETFSSDFSIRVSCAAILLTTVMFLWSGGYRYLKARYRHVVANTEMDKDISLMPVVILSFGSLLGVVMGAFGFSGFLHICGLPQVPAAEGTFFLTLGIAMDDYFVILSTYQRYVKRSVADISSQDRVLNVLSQCIKAITLTTMATVSVLLVGMLNPFWHLRIFCLQAMMAVIGTYFASTVLVPMILYIYDKRTYRDSGNASSADLNVDDEIVQKYAMIDVRFQDFAKKGKCRQLLENDIVTKAYVYGLLISNKLVRILIIVIFGSGTIAFLALIIMKMRIGMDLVHILPRSDTFRQYLDVHRRMFPDLGDILNVSVTVDTSLPGAMDDIKLLNMEIWRVCAKYELKYCTDSIGDLLRSQDPDSPMVADVTVLMDVLGRLEKNRMHPLHDIFFTPSAELIKLENQTLKWRSSIVQPWRNDSLGSYMWYMDISDKFNSLELNTATVSLSGEYLSFYSGDLRTLYVASLSVASSMLSVTVLTFLFMNFDFLRSLVVGGMMIIANIFIIGMMVAWQIKLNIMSLINLIVAQGFVIDYIAHIALAFHNSELDLAVFRTQSAIMMKTLPICASATTTILAVLCLVINNQYINQVFWRMTVSVITIGLTVSQALFTSCLASIPLLRSRTVSNGRIKKTIPTNEYMSAAVKNIINS